jgi:PAS domain S-box-containing protein
MSKADTVLYIDDEPINLESFKISFEDSFDIYTAESAYDAYKILAQNEIKIVISDQRMPEITGIELLEVVKNKYPDIVRILLTAYVHQEYLMEAINRGGVYRYLTKPWNIIELDSVIKNAIEIYDLKSDNKKLIKQLEDKVTEISISEEKFRNIFNSSTDGIMIIGLDKKIINANKAIFNVTGFSTDEIIGRNYLDFILPEYHELLIDRIKQISDNFKLDYAECEAIEKDGNKIFLEVKGSIIEYDGRPAMLAIVHDITERKQFEKQLYTARVNAEEKERERIAKDLHDGIGPLLSTLKIYLYDIQKSSEDGTNMESVAKSGEIINEAISCVKEISNNVSPHVLRNFGLTQAIKSFLEKLVIKSDIKFKLNSNLNIRVSEIIEITFYRIATELINNTLKYAGANNIEIIVIKTEKNLSFNYKDDGIGFDYNTQIKESKGFGLQNIQSRVHAIGGELNFSSSHGNGVNVIINVNIS